MIRDRKDFYAGLLFVAFGLGAVVIARDYPMGSTLRMGPGYFPTLLGGALTLVGLLLAGRALLRPGPAIGPFALRPLLLVVASVLAFAAVIRPAGLVAATLLVVVTSRLGGREWRPGETALLAVALAALGTALFVYALGLPFAPWPR